MVGVVPTSVEVYMDYDVWFDLRVGARVVVPEGELMMHVVNDPKSGEYTHVLRLHQRGVKCIIRMVGDRFVNSYPPKAIPGRRSKKSGHKNRGLIAMVRMDMLQAGNTLEVLWLNDKNPARKSVGFGLVSEEQVTVQAKQQLAVSVLGCRPGVQCTGGCNSCDATHSSDGRSCGCGAGERCRQCGDDRPNASLGGVGKA